MATIKVLIVEDSGLVAEVLTTSLESDKRIRVVGVASNGREALEMMPKLAPDLVTVDIWMPVMDGFATVEWIMAHQPTPILVITSSKLKQDIEISLRMLAAGALDVIEKPAMDNENEWRNRQAELVAKVKLLSGVRVITHVRGKELPTGGSQKAGVGTQKELASNQPSNPNPSGKKEAASFPLSPQTSKPSPRPVNSKTAFFPLTSHYQMIAIASSTGGPTALLRVLQKLPAELPAGIVVVQHITEGFTQGLVDWLQRETPLKLKLARDGDSPLPGQVLFAPDKRDILIGPDLKLVTSTQGNHILRPNADIFMESVAHIYGRRAIGVILTGMGQDGALGLKSMYDSGAYTIGQDEATSLIYGMPRAAAERGGVRTVLPLESIAPHLIDLLQFPASPEARNGQR